MKRLALVLMLASLAVLGPARAQEKRAEVIPGQAEEKTAEGEKPGLAAWKWANFVLLAGILGWAVKKNAGPFFAARTRQIRKAMLEADDLRQQAEIRAADVDRRLANLDAEIAALRAESAREAESEAGRLSQLTAAEIAKIGVHAEQEIASAAKAASLALKRYSAEAAIRLAQDKIQARMTPQIQDALLRDFVRRLEAPGSPGPTS